MAAVGLEKAERLREMRWGPMVAVSAFFHLVVFSVFLFAPDSFPHRRAFEGVVYEVNLVEMPAGGMKTPAAGTKPAKTSKAPPAKMKPARAKRISAPPKKTKPLVIAKRTVDKKTSVKKKRKASASELIDRAISKIERKVKSDDRSHVDKAISRLESQVASREDSGPVGGGSLVGVPMQIYQMEVESWIKSNWAYPVAMGDSEDLEAIVVLRVRADGTILKSRFLKSSKSDIFDQSVLKAIERSDPLPQFPETYRKSYEEFEINFNLRDLENL